VAFGAWNLANMPFSIEGSPEAFASFASASTYAAKGQFTDDEGDDFQ